MKMYNEDSGMSLFLRIAKVALENSMSSKIVGKELDISPEELDRLYEMIIENLS
jgi:hypothetical protein